MLERTILELQRKLFRANKSKIYEIQTLQKKNTMFKKVLFKKNKIIEKQKYEVQIQKIKIMKLETWKLNLKDNFQHYMKESKKKDDEGGIDWAMGKLILIINQLK